MSGGWYGSIELNDFQIIIDSDEEDSEEFLSDVSRRVRTRRTTA